MISEIVGKSFAIHALVVVEEQDRVRIFNERTGKHWWESRERFEELYSPVEVPRSYHIEDIRKRQEAEVKYLLAKANLEKLSGFEVPRRSISGHAQEFRDKKTTTSCPIQGRKEFSTAERCAMHRARTGIHIPYPSAMEIASYEIRMTRPCYFDLGQWIESEGKRGFFLCDDRGMQVPYQPTEEDKQATDWFGYNGE